MGKDILNVAEVQDCHVLTILNEKLKGMNYLPYLLLGTDTHTGQNVGLLTRIDPSTDILRTGASVPYPIPSSTCDSSLSGAQAVSKHYYTTFEIKGLQKPLTIFGMHFLAFPDNSERCVKREAQATVIKRLIEEELRGGRSVVAMGDLNDFDPTIVDASDSIPISSVLALLRDPVPSNPGDELVNVAQYVQAPSDRYSNWYDRDDNCKLGPNELSLIDHLLISQDLVPLVSKAYMDHSYGPSCSSLEIENRNGSKRRQKLLSEPHEDARGREGCARACRSLPSEPHEDARGRVLVLARVRACGSVRRVCGFGRLSVLSRCKGTRGSGEQGGVRNRVLPEGVVYALIFSRATFHVFIYFRNFRVLLRFTRVVHKGLTRK
eukprot:Phypoly_transcript_09550.p1 GENE.Phypoly_transcript_09550~~Phypoly_transcript_09550.p1  ORF type:complete len:378 (+),score=27.05 Phypoly_transcript_09550:156-1289(+)